MFDDLANAAVVAHVAFVLFVLPGGLLLVLRWPRLGLVHVPAALWGVWIEVSGWICPLTALENWLRRRGGGAGYASSFVEHDVVPLLSPAALTRDQQWLLAGVVVLVNVAMDALVLGRRGRG
jgi:uncharacterized membrane protein YhhN